MSKVEEKALEALDMYAPKGINEQVGLVYTKAAVLGMFKDGYHQAEKDNELTWEDIKEICRMWIESKTPFGVTGEALSIEVLNRFKGFKERKEK